MRARDAVTPVVLLVLAAGTAAYAYLIDSGTLSDADRAERAKDVFPSFRVNDVTRIEIRHAAETLVLERNGGAGSAGTWSMAAPRRDLVDPAQVDVLLRELELAVRLRKVSRGGARGGTDTPRVSGVITMGPITYRFALGSDAPTPEGAAYVEVDGEGTFVVAHSLKVQLLRGAEAYRDHTLVPLGASQVARFAVGPASGGGFALERHGQTFRVAGTALRASRAGVDRLFAALADVRAESFLEDAEADRALGPNAISLSIVPRERAQRGVELRIGGPCPGQVNDVVVIRLPGPVPPSEGSNRVSACVPKTTREALEAPLEGLLDRSLLFANADEVEQLLMEPGSGGSPRLDIARRGTGWHERSPEDRELAAEENDAANALLVALTTARAIDVRRPGPDERMAVRARVSLVRTGAGGDEVVELGPAGEDGVTLARRLDDGAVLRLARSVARRLEPQPLALRSHAVWRNAVDVGSVLAIDDSCGAAPQRLEWRRSAWAMRTPSGFAVDQASATDLARGVAEAHTNAWIAERDDGTFGFSGADSCTVTLTLDVATTDASQRSESLVFGAEGDGGVYAHTLDEPAVFVVPTALRELASHPVIDGHRLRIDTAVVDRVTMVRDGTSFVLDRAGERFVQKIPSRPDSGDGAKLGGALAGLYALRAIHAGPPRADEEMDHPTLVINATAFSDANTLDTTRITIGAPTRIDANDVYVARVGGVDATFAVPSRAVRAILDAL